MMDAAAPQEGIDIAIERVMEMIPHRYPMLLIDKVINVVAGESATGVKNVTFNEHFFQGHFPSKPVMPGVLIIESLAQTAAVLVVHTLGPDAEGKLVYFMSVDNAKVRKPVGPGDVVHARVVKDRRRNAVWRIKGEARVDGVLVAEATITAMIQDR
jgi:3-hydroxyacyl-[acyl-carrier-protein] dehydratase